MYNLNVSQLLCAGMCECVCVCVHLCVCMCQSSCIAMHMLNSTTNVHNNPVSASKYSFQLNAANSAPSLSVSLSLSVSRTHSAVEWVSNLTSIYTGPQAKCTLAI